MSVRESQHSVSEWLTTVNASTDEAETAWRQLWDHYAPQVLALAREHLAHGRKPLLAESDVVVVQDLFCGMQAGRFPRLTSRVSVRTVRRKVRAVAQRWQQVVAAGAISRRDLRQAFDTWRGVERNAEGSS
jgi:hypothetical protein